MKAGRIPRGLWWLALSDGEIMAVVRQYAGGSLVIPKGQPPREALYCATLADPRTSTLPVSNSCAFPL